MTDRTQKAIESIRRTARVGNRRVLRYAILAVMPFFLVPLFGFVCFSYVEWSGDGHISDENIFSKPPLLNFAVGTGVASILCAFLGCAGLLFEAVRSLRSRSDGLLEQVARLDKTDAANSSGKVLQDE